MRLGKGLILQFTEFNLNIISNYLLHETLPIKNKPLNLQVVPLIIVVIIVITIRLAIKKPNEIGLDIIVDINFQASESTL